MFLRSKRRCKDGKAHRYFSVVENRRVGSGRVVQRQVLFLGEINDRQQGSWRKTLEVFDEAEQRARTLNLFPEDREIPADALDGVQVKLAEMELRRPRGFGSYWLGCELWRQLGLSEFWEERLGEGREEVAWAKVLELLVVTPEGFPLAYEIMAGNTSDRTTLHEFLAKIEAQYGRARRVRGPHVLRVGVMDRGIPTEEVLTEMRDPQREGFYLVGTPRGKIGQYEKKWLELRWRKVRESVEVKLFAEGGEL
jgi:hypothetical protein